MADFNTTRTSASRITKDDKSIMAQARKDWDAAMDRERDNIKAAYEDLEFYAGRQWEAKQLQDRANEGRPTLTVNRLPQFCHQITGDMRQMKPSVKVVPVDDSADEKVADLLGGLIRYIENRSHAPAVYARAADSQVACGIAHWRIESEYASAGTFNQELRITPIEDGVAVLWDPDAKLPTKEDARYCFVPVDMNRNTFEELYPKNTPESFDDEHWGQNAQWVTDDYVRVAEYWVKKRIKVRLALFPDGKIFNLDEEDDPARMERLAKKAGARIESRDAFKVCCYWITASTLLKEVEHPGQHIPVVTLVGEEIRIGRKCIRQGVVRRAI